MLRLRRYRIFLLVAVLTCVTVYHLSHVQNWDATSSVRKLKNLGSGGKDQGAQAGQEVQQEQSKDETRPQQPEIEEEKHAAVHVTSAAAIGDASGQVATSLTSSTAATSSSSSTLANKVQPTATQIAKGPERMVEEEDDDPDTEPAIPPSRLKEELAQVGHGRLEAKPLNLNLPQPHWRKQPERFPVPSGSLIPLPTGRSKKIPTIQKAFNDETVTAKTDRERKLAAIKDAFSHAWQGYKEHAMPHDELTPVSGGWKDPFMGWGATLVDTLDSLWILGLTDEFEAALDEVKKIDFTTSPRKDIPVFETVIRYLGGLLAAYDLSSQRYRVLLDKAIELAEVLMGAFDTPNRMPQTYYYWAPSYASQAHRAGTRVVLAELGSLSMEFTRLAQLTRDDKYYDAIARITNELEAMQNNTKVPGLWPIHIDASGCKKPKHNLGQDASLGKPQDPLSDHAAAAGTEATPSNPKGRAVSQGLGTEQTKQDTAKRQLDDADQPSKGSLSKSMAKANSLPEAESPKEPELYDAEVVEDPDPLVPQLDLDCEPQGLTSPPYKRTDTFSLGAMTDSTFEYLPKEYLLLGGQVSQYQTMYESAMNAAREHLLFRPMIKSDKDILFAGKLTTAGQGLDPEDEEEIEDEFDFEAAHLTCFAGGMFAVGAKIFGIEDDLDIARKLTDGCIWAYESMPTRVMAEAALLLPCDDPKACNWNETKWWDALDPYSNRRIQQGKDWNDQQRKLAEQLALAEAHGTADGSGKDMPVETSSSEASSKELGGGVGGSALDKRQIVKSAITYEDESTAKAAARNKEEPTKTIDDPKGDSDRAAVPSDKIDEVLGSIFTPRPILSHEDFAKKMIEDSKLPDGFLNIIAPKYILRPEAIESVFIMYRVTGDEYWRDKGWKMFTAIQKLTRTEYGNSAIRDVTRELPEFDDTMESFWLAETLKYFYLLFSDPSVLSLDEWVLNTEAHPFKRPV